MRIFSATLTLVCLSGAAVWAADAKAGQAAYDRACKSCHGADGAANPALAKMMKVEIADLKSPGVQNLSDADLKKIITDGKGKMRPISSVSGADLDNVVVLRDFAVAPRRCGVRADRKTLREQFGALVLVERNNNDIHLFAAKLNA